MKTSSVQNQFWYDSLARPLWLQLGYDQTGGLDVESRAVIRNQMFDGLEQSTSHTVKTILLEFLDQRYG